MIIDENTVHHVADLARLELKNEEVQPMVREMNKILGWMEKINEIDTFSVEPLIHISHEINTLREDNVGEMLRKDETFTNAPQHDNAYFVVPKVID